MGKSSTFSGPAPGAPFSMPQIMPMLTPNSFASELRLLAWDVLIRDRSHSQSDVRFAPTNGKKADVPGGPSWADAVEKEARDGGCVVIPLP